MSGNRSGGLKAAKTNKELFGDDFYSKIGKKGGKKSKNGGFASSKIGDDGLTGQQRASVAGAKGGKRSVRGSAKKTIELINKHSDTIIKMLYNDEPITKIAEVTGINRNTLYYYIRNHRTLKLEK